MTVSFSNWLDRFDLLCCFLFLVISAAYFIKYFYGNKNGPGRAVALLSLLGAAGAGLAVRSWPVGVAAFSFQPALPMVAFFSLGFFFAILLWEAHGKKETALRVQEGEARYKSLFNEMITGVAVHALVRDAQGVPVDYRFLEVNAAFERLTGLRQTDVIAKTAREILPDIEPERIERYARVALTGVSERFQMYSASLGKYFDMRVFGAGPDRFAVVFDDITERTQTIEELAGMTRRLRQQQKELMAIANISGTDLKAVAAQITPLAAAGLEVSRVSIWFGSRADEQLVCLDLFEAEEKTHRHGMRLATGRCVRYFQALEDEGVIDAGDACRDPRLAELCDEFLKPSGISARVDAAVRMSGRTVAVIAFEHAGAIRAWRPDEVKFAAEVAEQIERIFLGVERCRHEEALREKSVDLERERTNLQAIFDTVQVGMLLINKDGVVRRVNSAAATFAGRDAAQLLGQQPGGALGCLHSFQTPEGCGYAPSCPRCSLRRIFLRVMVTGELLTGQEVKTELVINKEVRAVWLELAAGPIMVNGERHVLLALTDVSARRRAEETLRDAKEAAEAADKVKSEFLANMSHEVRTPMNAILGFAQLLQHTSLNEKQANYVGTIMSSGTMLMRIISDVLDLSKMAAGKITLDNIEFELRPLLDEAVLFARPQAQEAVRFVQDIALDVPSVLIGDPLRLRQVLRNLLENAVKFTSEGTVTLRVRRMLWEVPGRVKLAIEVQDTGIGILPEKVEKIFEPLPQADMSPTRLYGGTGMGLAICRAIIQAMGGRISMVSEPGKGSTVTFTAVFSVAIAGVEAEMPGLSGPGSPTPVFKGVRVLVVEDNLPNRELIKELLSALECDAMFARDGKEGVALLREHAFDMCLMDVQMPVMGGEEATRIIRSSLTRTMPIIALTGAAMPGDRHRLLTSGMTDYLAKPVSLEQLRDKIALYAPKEMQG